MHFFRANFCPIRCKRFFSVFAILCCFTSSANADIFAGRSGQGANDVRIVSIFEDSMNGNVEPLSLLGGNNTALSFVTAMTYDPVDHLIYMSDFTGQKIVLFDANARLNVSPVRSFNNIFLGQPRDVAIDHVHDEIIVNNSNFIFAFPIGASGTVTSIRNTTYDPNLIRNLGGMALLPDSDELAVADYQTVASVNQGVIHFFPRTVSGAPVQSRFIAGGLTQLGEYVADLIYVQSRQEIIALVGFTEAGVSKNKIVVFSESATGDATPLRVISGANTLLEYASSLSYYEASNEILVSANTYGGDTPRILGFAVGANGNIEPIRNIGGNNTAMTPGQGWYSVLGVDLTQIFKNGFE